MGAKGLEKLGITEEQAEIIVKKELPLELSEPVIKDSQEKRKELKLSVEDKKKIERLGKHDLPYLEFLELAKDVRFYECTKGNVDLKDIKEGNIKDISFDFKFGGEKINEKIYLGTTAGQLLPQEVAEVSLAGSTYKRSGLLGEFFNESGKRLTIHQGTEINVSKLLGEEEMVKIEEKNSKKVNTFLDNHSVYTKEKEQTKKVLLIQIADEAQKRNIDIDFAIKICMSSIEGMSTNDNYAIAAKIENVLTDFARIRGIYRTSGKLDNKGKYDDRVALQMFKTHGGSDWRKDAKNYGIEGSHNQVQSNTKAGNYNFNSILDSKITNESIIKINNIERFRAGSNDTKILFKTACKIAKIDESWANNPYLHKIMLNESGGIVGNLNYTIKGMDLSEYKRRSLNSKSNNPIGSKSTASGLGQLLLSNIDKYYPSGRKGIGNPIEEAVGLIRYIRDRYGNPDIAMSVYGRKGSYVNSRTGKKRYKSFKEGY